MSDVLDGVFNKIKHLLTPKDLEKLSSRTSVRWVNKAQRERQRLKTEGYLKRDSPRGIWDNRTGQEASSDLKGKT